MSPLFRALAAAAVLACAAVPPAFATPVIFDTESTFLAAAGSVSTEGFEGLTATNDFGFARTFSLDDFTFTLGTPNSLSGGGVRNTPFLGAHATDGVNFIVDSTSSGVLGNGSTFPVVLTFVHPINRFGIHITDFGDDDSELGALVFNTDVGSSGYTPLTPLADGNTQFFGMTDTAAFHTIQIFLHIGGGNFNVGYDQVSYGSPAGTPLPEPATLALLGLGLATVLVMRRAR